MKNENKRPTESLIVNAALFSVPFDLYSPNMFQFQFSTASVSASHPEGQQHEQSPSKHFSYLPEIFNSTKTNAHSQRSVKWFNITSLTNWIPPCASNYCK